MGNITYDISKLYYKQVTLVNEFFNVNVDFLINTINKAALFLILFIDFFNFSYICNNRFFKK